MSDILWGLGESEELRPQFCVPSLLVETVRVTGMVRA